jgi:hypothetical protein
MVSIVTGVMDAPVGRVHGWARGAAGPAGPPDFRGSHEGHPLGGPNDLMRTVAPASERAFANRQALGW